MKPTEAKLRWGFSTGACAAALASAAWLRLHGTTPREITVRFLDGVERVLPLLEPCEGRMAAIRKDGGDDPDCTHQAVLFANLRPCHAVERRPEDYRLLVGGGVVILRGAEGVGLCTRPGLDCEQGKWAINTGPRRMIAENLRRLGLNTGCWLLEIGVENGGELARRTLNPRLGVVGGISLLGTTGLVRPYSHEAYIKTIRICVRAHRLAGGTVMVFCTGGRTRAGAGRRLPELPETAFVCIGDFIAESLATARAFGMREIIVACMPGKLCKYAAGCGNTHARKASQDMEPLKRAVRRALPDAPVLHATLERSVSVREALLSIPEAIRLPLLRRLARTALDRFAARCGDAVALKLFVFDFEGRFLLGTGRARRPHPGAAPPPVPPPFPPPDAERLTDDKDAVGPTYFVDARREDAPQTEQAASPAGTPPEGGARLGGTPSGASPPESPTEAGGSRTVTPFSRAWRESLSDG